MYIEAPQRTGRIAVSPPLALAILICTLGVVGVGVYPKPLVELTLRVANALF